jgi:hypothetical protein
LMPAEMPMLVFGREQVLPALATAAAVGALMPPTPVSLTVTTRRTLMRFAIPITACGLPEPLHRGLVALWYFEVFEIVSSAKVLWRTTKQSLK